MAIETYERFLELGGETREQVREDLAAGGELVEGMRRDTLFSLALELAHRGLDEALIGFCVAEVNRRLCRPPLGARDIEHQVHGAVVRARRRPSREQELHQRALQALATVTDTPTAVVARASGRPPAKHHEALELVREMLASRPRPSAEVKAEGRARGLSERTVEQGMGGSLGSFPRSPGTPRAGKADGSLFGTRRQSFGATAGSFGATARSFGATARVLSRPPLRTLRETGRDKTVAPSSNPGLYVGLSGGSVTPSV